MKTYILITDIQYRKAFDVVSILLKSFPEYDFLLGTEKSRLYTALCYGRNRYVRLRTECGRNAFFQDCDALANKFAEDKVIYIPVEENTTDLFVEYIEEKKPKCFSFLLPTGGLYKKFRNKLSLNEYCLKNGFSAPRIFDTRNLESAEYPIILKPAIGSGSAGIIRLQSISDLTANIRQTVENGGYIAQELIPEGNKVRGAFFLCKDGKVVCAHTHKRIRTAPEEGGVSVLSQMQYDDSLIKQGGGLLEFSAWNGLVMLEYLWDKRTQSYKIIEANPRLWGSVMLSEFGGAYLLTNYVRLCLGESPIEQDINTGRYIRWLFPTDIINLFKKGFRIPDFWNFKNQCIINWTYARKDRALWFFISSAFNMKNIKKLFRR